MLKATAKNPTILCVSDQYSQGVLRSFLLFNKVMIYCTIFRLTSAHSKSPRADESGRWLAWNVEYWNACNQISESPRADKFFAALIQWCTDLHKT